MSLEKVTAFVTRTGSAGVALLLFRRQNEGIQLVAGAVEAVETPAAAVIREVYEVRGWTLWLSSGRWGISMRSYRDICSWRTPPEFAPGPTHPASTGWSFAAASPSDHCARRDGSRRSPTRSGTHFRSEAFSPTRSPAGRRAKSWHPCNTGPSIT